MSWWEETFWVGGTSWAGATSRGSVLGSRSRAWVSPQPTHTLAAQSLVHTLPRRHLLCPSHTPRAPRTPSLRAHAARSLSQSTRIFLPDEAASSCHAITSQSQFLCEAYMLVTDLASTQKLFLISARSLTLRRRPAAISGVAWKW